MKWDRNKNKEKDDKKKEQESKDKDNKKDFDVGESDTVQKDDEQSEDKDASKDASGADSRGYRQKEAPGTPPNTGVTDPKDSVRLRHPDGSFVDPKDPLYQEPKQADGEGVESRLVRLLEERGIDGVDVFPIEGKDAVRVARKGSNRDEGVEIPLHMTEDIDAVVAHLGSSLKERNL